MVAGHIERRRAVIYIRVSSVGGRDVESTSYRTEDQQRSECELYARRAGYEVVGVYRDIDVSGAVWDREGLDEVLALVERREIDAVIALDLSRVGRGIVASIGLAKRLTEAGVQLLTVAENLDLSTPAGRMQFHMLATVAEHERERISARWAMSKSEARARGVLVGPTPFGYVRAPDATLTPDPAAAPVVHAMFAARAAGATFESLAGMVDQVRRTRTGRPTHQNQAARIIRNPIYRGVMPGGATCPALVTDDEWYAAQTAIQPRRSGGGHHFVLSGIATCANCGGPMVGDSYGGTSKDTPVYVCRNRSRTAEEKCLSAPSIVAKRIEPWVVGHVERVAKLQLEADADIGATIAALDQAVTRADADLVDFASDLDARRKLGSRWHAQLDLRVEALEAAKLAAAQARRDAVVVDGASWDQVLRDPVLLQRALSRAIVWLRVSRGRGPVDERCDLRLLL